MSQLFRALCTSWPLDDWFPKGTGSCCSYWFLVDFLLILVNSSGCHTLHTWMQFYDMGTTKKGVQQNGNNWDQHSNRARQQVINDNGNHLRGCDDRFQETCYKSPAWSPTFPALLTLVGRNRLKLQPAVDSFGNFMMSYDFVTSSIMLMSFHLHRLTPSLCSVVDAKLSRVLHQHLSWNKACSAQFVMYMSTFSIFQ